MRRRPTKTPPFRGPDGDILSGSIAEAGMKTLGGVEQWIMIRGANAANPPLIFLHGGPGLSETAFFRYYNSRELERSFTVVYWDQRGAGKSWHPDLPKSSMTIEQFLSDLDELVEHVRARLGAAKVTLFGHSWGAGLGVLYAARHPDKVAAYVGSGQVSDWLTAETASYKYALAEAERRGNKKALAELRAIGAPPYSAEALFKERTWLARFEGKMKPRSLWNIARAVLGTPEESLLEMRRGWRSFHWTIDAIWNEALHINLFAQAPELKMPVFFFLGRKDHWVPPETSAAYLEALAAPSKKLVWFEESGHEPFMDEPDKFNAAMLSLVLPVARGELPAAGLHVAGAERSRPQI
ncbi:MAG TPA: alpha/beta hydrolase [Kofleriaceae bacterium]|nr:alpha/beta hydrolase [Kofleriaceae bacterium]